jgi:hypothetical protein
MANWMKQVTKGASHVLEPGESFVAAQQFNKSSVLGGGEGTARAVGGMIGAAAAAVVDKRREKREEERQRDVAESTGVPEADVSWPGPYSIVALTDRRLLFFGMKGLAGAGDVFHQIPRDGLVRVDRIDVEGSMTAGRIKTLEVRFVQSDGTAISAHAPYMGVNRKRVDRFLSAVDAAT